MFVADLDFKKMHGCACGRPGTQIARRDRILITREWEVDVKHSDGKVHTNIATLHQGLRLK